MEKNNVEYVYNGVDGSIIKLSSHEDVELFKQDTSWSISSNDNILLFDFKKYPVYIFITPDNKKFKLSKNNNHLQLIDANNNEVKNEILEKYYALFRHKKEILPPSPYKEMKEKIYNFDMYDWHKYLIDNPKDFIYLPQGYYSDAILNHITDLYPEYYCLIPDPYITENICRKYALKYPEVFLYNTHKRRFKTIINEIIQLLTIENKIIYLQHIPCEYISFTLFNKKSIEYAVLNETINFKYLINNPYFTEELLLKFLKLNPNRLKFIPKEIKTKSLVKKILAYNGKCLHQIPEHLRDYELCKIAYNNNKESYKDIPEKFKDFFKK